MNRNLTFLLVILKAGYVLKYYTGKKPYDSVVTVKRRWKVFYKSVLQQQTTAQDSTVNLRCMIYVVFLKI